MWTALKIEDSRLISKAYNKLEADFIRIVSRHLDKPEDSDIFKIDIDGTEYDINNSISYLLFRSSSDNLSGRLSPNVGVNELKRFSDISLKPISAKSNAKRTDKITRAVPFEKIVTLTLLQKNTMWYDMVAAITQVNAQLFSKLICEIVTLSIVVLKAYDDDYFINDLTLHSAAVYYWACQFTEFIKYRDKIWPEIYYKSKRKPGINSNESLSDFMHRIVTTKFSADLAVRLLKEEYATGKEVALVIYDNFDDLIKSVKLQTAHSEYLKRVHSDTKDILRNGGMHMPNALANILGKKNIDKYAYASMVSSYIIPKYSDGYNMYIIPLWVLYEYYEKGNKKILSEDKLNDLEQLLQIMTEKELAVSCIFCYSLILSTISKVFSRIDYLNSKIDKLKANETESSQKLTHYRSEKRALNKEKARLEKELRQLSAELGQLKTRLNNSNIPVDEFEKLKETSINLTDENKRLKGLLDEQTRKTYSIEKQLASSREEHNECRKKINEQANKIRRLEKSNRELLLSTEESKVQQSAYINAIKNKRIAIIGGMKLHSRLQSLGLENLRLFEEECKNIQFEDIINQDLVVVITSFVDHSSIAKAVRICRQNKVKLLNYNNFNVDSLIYAMFSEIYK